MTTTITPEEINVFQKAYLQLWDIDEGDLSIYRHIDGQVFPLSEMDTPEEIARELAQVWETAWPRISGLINALKSAESAAAKWEHDYYVLMLEMDGCLSRLESATHTISTLRRDLELAKKGAEMAESEYQRANDVSGKLMQMSVDLERTAQINHALKDRAVEAEERARNLDRELNFFVLRYVEETASFDCGYELAPGYGEQPESDEEAVRMWRRWVAEQTGTPEETTHQKAEREEL